MRLTAAACGVSWPPNYKSKLDRETFVQYNIAKLSNLTKRGKGAMTTKSISSTKAQNNFGRVLDDITQHHTRYIVKRRGIPQVIILSFDDFADVLNNEHKREQMHTVLRGIRPKYKLGQVLESQSE